MITLAAFATLSGAAFAQTDPHHPAAETPQTTTTAPAAEAMLGGSPEQCTTMMSKMQKMMPMMQQMMLMHQMMQMQQMMQSGEMPAGQGGMMPGGQGGMMNMPMDTANMSESSKAYMDAMKQMDGPMMQGIKAGDPDVAFVQAMIPHHQAAIDMARAVLQFGKDDQVKVWANQIIAAQQAEIAAMQEWLKQHAK
ncbi:CopM family metallochaperone [Mesorhizobium amorphae]|nr:DUF305 domain-containing protein [Mesorhizobium amorphae]